MGQKVLKVRLKHPIVQQQCSLCKKEEAKHLVPLLHLPSSFVLERNMDFQACFAAQDIQ